MILNRPNIGITGPDKGGNAAWLFTAASIWMTGGIPIRIRPSRPKDPERLDGLIIGGGADVDPAIYEESEAMQEYLNATLKNKRWTLAHRITRFIRWITYPFFYLLRILFTRKSWTIDKDRDHLELNLIDKAVKKGLPVLGICRGAQLINVYFKGTLHQEITGFYYEYPNRESLFPVKTIKLRSGSKLCQLLGTASLKVNALHHQAVKEPGENIEIVGREPTGVVQAIEHTELPFVIGVQWHPEYLINRKLHRSIFKALVKQARTMVKLKRAGKFRQEQLVDSKMYQGA